MSFCSLGIDKIMLTDPLQKENSIKWLFSQEHIKTNTPSRQRGMSYDDEMKLRRLGIRFMSHLAARVSGHSGQIQVKDKKNPRNSRVFATAAVCFHRFYMVHPFQIFDCSDISIACYFLASKAEDEPQSITTIVSTAHNLLLRYWLVPVQSSIDELEEELKDLESCMMKTLGFVVWVRHPNPYIQWLIHQFIIGSKDKLSKIQQLADRYSADSLYTPFCVRENPKKLAIAFISWACQQEGFEVNNWQNKTEFMSNWLQVFNLKQEDVDSLYKEYCEHMFLNMVEKKELESRFNKNVSTEIRLPTDSQGPQLLHGPQFTDVSECGNPID